jgi:hypothetical protein
LLGPAPLDLGLLPGLNGDVDVCRQWPAHRLKWLVSLVWSG